MQDQCTTDSFSCRLSKSEHSPGQRAPPPLASRCAPWLYEWSCTAGLCAADRAAVEGFPWPGRRQGWTELGGRSPGLRLLAAVLPP